MQMYEYANVQTPERVCDLCIFVVTVLGGVVIGTDMVNGKWLL